jgi:periplasmic protein CpxP/Spy
MKPRLTTCTALAFLVTAIAFPIGLMFPPSPASAQTGAAPATAAKSASGSTSDPMARVEKRISTLHAQLKITAAEEPQWQKFADVMRDNAQKMNQSASDRAQKFQSMNAVDNMKSYADLAVQHGQNMQALAVAFTDLYNSMSPDQQKVADQVFRNRTARKRSG